MKRSSLLSIVLMLFVVSLACSQISSARSSSRLVLVGSTPANPEVRKMLGIAGDVNVEFIRWELTITETAKIFSLKAIYGETLPNTRGFKEEKYLALDGKYEIAAEQKGKVKREIYRLAPGKNGIPISLVKINDNIFHLLNSDNTLLVGDGGWSYTLNRKDAVGSSAGSLPVLSAKPDDKTAQVIFNGRTPCAEISTQFKIEVPEGCFKMKWKLTLNRDPRTLQPTTYTLNRIHHRLTVLEGKWALKEKAGAVIYQLDPDKPDQSQSFVAADENVLLFLDKNGRPFTGNYEFSYTLDRRSQ